MRNPIRLWTKHHKEVSLGPLTLCLSNGKFSVALSIEALNKILFIFIKDGSVEVSLCNIYK